MHQPYIFALHVNQNNTGNDFNVLKQTKCCHSKSPCGKLIWNQRQASFFIEGANNFPHEHLTQRTGFTCHHRWGCSLFTFSPGLYSLETRQLKTQTGDWNLLNHRFTGLFWCKSKWNPYRTETIIQYNPNLSMLLAGWCYETLHVRLQRCPICDS